MRDMIKILVGSFLFILCVASAYSQAPFTEINVAPRWVPDPDIQAGSLIVKGTNNTVRWLQIDVDYVTRPNKAGWLDNVVLKYDVLLPQTTRKAVVLSGQVEYWSIEMDGNKHHAQAFIHPKILKRYAPGVKMRKSALQDFRILVTVLVNESPVGGKEKLASFKLHAPMSIASIVSVLAI